MSNEEQGAAANSGVEENQADPIKNEMFDGLKYIEEHPSVTDQNCTFSYHGPRRNGGDVGE